MRSGALQPKVARYMAKDGVTLKFVVKHTKGRQKKNAAKRKVNAPWMWPGRIAWKVTHLEVVEAVDDVVLFEQGKHLIPLLPHQRQHVLHLRQL